MKLRILMLLSFAIIIFNPVIVLAAAGSGVSGSENFTTGIQFYCANGTAGYQCAANKPLYCSLSSAGAPELLNNCSVCGCPENSECQTDGSCKTAVQTPPAAGTAPLCPAGIVKKTQTCPDGSVVSCQPTCDPSTGETIDCLLPFCPEPAPKKCIEESEPNSISDTDCCPGLKWIQENKTSGYCTKCGDNICKYPENKILLNDIPLCPRDCLSPELEKIGPKTSRPLTTRKEPRTIKNSFTLPLETKWIYFSVPFKNFSITKTGNCEKAVGFYFNPVTLQWEYADDSKFFLDIDDFSEMMPGYAYAIIPLSSSLTNCQGNLTFSGTNYTIIDDIPGLKSGWTFIGAPHEPTFLRDMQGCNIYSLWSYTSENIRWIEVSFLEPGTMHAILVGNNCKLILNDRTPPEISDGKPSKIMADSTPTLSVRTNEKASCRGNIDADNSYNSMNLLFTTEDGYLHNYVIPKPVSDGLHTTYVKCKDANENINTDSYKWSFEVITQNKKDSSKYSDRTVFLISDEDWRDVLSLVPLGIWTDTANDVVKYPLLVYHGENNSFDADSVVHFMQQYKPKEVVIVGDSPQELDNLLIADPPLGAGLNEEQIRRTYLEHYLSYWQSIASIVVVDYNNYKNGLMASVWASYKNAPILFINEANLDKYKAVLNGRIVYTVGNLSSVVSEYINRNSGVIVQFTLPELQKRYVQETNTNKVILLNPDDLTIKQQYSFKPEKSSNSILEIYSKTSLITPILASAKHEVIIITNYTNFEDVDKSFTKHFNDLFNLDLMPRSCGPDESCSSGFIDKTLTFYATDSNTTAKFSATTTEPVDFTLFIQSAAILCKEENVKLVIYVNGKSVGENPIPCYNMEEILSESIFPPYYQIKFRLNFTLSGDSNLIVGLRNSTTGYFVVERMVLVNEATKKTVMNYEIPNENVSSLFQRDFTTKIATGNMSFKFKNYRSNHYLRFSVKGLGIEYLKLYLNGKYISDVSNIGTVMLLNNIQENSTIILEPFFNRDSGWAKTTLSLYPELDYYLTIMATPDAIQQSQQISDVHRKEVDTLYADLQNDDVVDLSVGRIYGLTSSDVSAYVARSLFFSYLDKNKNLLILDPTISPTYPGRNLYEILDVSVTRQFDEIHGCSGADNCKAFRNMLPYYYNTSYLTTYSGHGTPGGLDFHGDPSTQGFYSHQLPFNTPAIIMADTCFTCCFTCLGNTQLFCTNNLRKGSMIYVGAVHYAATSELFLNALYPQMFLEEVSGGLAWRRTKTLHVNNNLKPRIESFIFLGDPTFIPRWWQ